MRPAERRDSSLDLIVVRLSKFSLANGTDTGTHEETPTHIHDRLEIKGRPVPQHEFTRMSSSEKSSSLGRPSYHDNGLL